MKKIVNYKVVYIFFSFSSIALQGITMPSMIRPPMTRTNVAGAFCTLGFCKLFMSMRQLFYRTSYESLLRECLNSPNNKIIDFTKFGKRYQEYSDTDYKVAQYKMMIRCINNNPEGKEGHKDLNRFNTCRKAVFNLATDKKPGSPLPEW